MTTEQVTDLCFENLTTARHRLTALYELRVLDRFRPFRPVGSDPYHYLLDTLGVEVVAAERGVEVPRPGLHHSRALALVDSQRLAHLLGVNGLFCALARWARTVEDAELAEWWPERRCTSEWGEVVRPDGFGALRQRDGPPPCGRPRPPQAPGPGQLAAMARALVALAEETRGDRLAPLALSRSDRPAAHPAAGKKKGGRSCAA